jgi:alginate O-acetyltransferase complex protein AlgI
VRNNPQPFHWSLVVEGITRILIGGVKKFFIADVLLVHLLPGPDLIPSISTASAWIRLYSFALYIFFDFSGFTDIAIGTGRLLGYTLPENFNAPYLKPNLAQFWQSWHITLSTWLRFYVFSPLSRRLLRTRLGSHPLLVVFYAQIVTMLLIGLWHGITINFALWGLWHGLGLFVHKVYADRTRRWQLRLQQKPVAARMVGILSTLATFHFVTLGWVFFMFPDPADSAALLRRLFGLPG